MTTEVDLCTNGGGSLHEEEVSLSGRGKEESDGDGSFVLLNVKDGVEFVGGGDPVVEGDLIVKSSGQAGKSSSVNVEGEGEDLKAENGVNGNCIIEEYVNGVEEVLAVRGDAESEVILVAVVEQEQGSVDVAVADTSAREQERGSIVGAESERLLVDAAVGDGSSGEQNGSVVSEEREHENVALAEEQEHEGVAESEGLLVDADSVGEQNGTVVSEDQEQASIAATISEGVLVDAEVADSSAPEEQNGTVISEEHGHESVIVAEAEELLVDAEVTDSSVPREQNGTVISEEQEHESVIVAEAKEILVDAEVTDSSAPSDENGAVVSEEQEHESATVAETENILVDAEVADGSAPSDQNGAVVSEEHERESDTVAETEKLLVDAEVADSSAPSDQNGAVVSEAHELESVASAATDGLLVDGAVTNNSAEGHAETVVSKEQEHESIAAAQTEELLVDASLTVDSAEEQTGTVVSKEHEHENVSVGESDGLLSVGAVANDSAGEQNGTVVAEEQQQVSIGAAQSDEILVDAATTDSGADGEQNGTVVSEEQVQGSIVVADESEALVVDAGEENGIGSTEQAQESQNGTVVAADSESARDITVAEQIEVQSNGCLDYNAPILDAGKFSNVVESDLNSAGHAQECNAAGDEKARNVNENNLVSTEQCEESVESKVQVSYVEPELCQLNNDDDVKDNQECVGSGAPIDLEHEKKPELANNLTLDGVPAKGELDFEQDRKAVLSGNIQSETVKEKFDHLEKERVNDPIGVTVNKTEGGLNSESESNYIPTAADSNMPEEVNEIDCEGTKGQPTNADVSFDMETNTVDINIIDLKRVDIELPEKNDKDVICEHLAESETSVLVEDADDGEDQLVDTAHELVEETQTVAESNNEVSKAPEDESSKDGEPQRVDEGEAQLVETASELVEEAQVFDESKNEVAQVPEDESSGDGAAQQAEVACEVVEKALQGSKNEVGQVAEVETGEGGSKNEGKSDSEATDIQHAEANSIAESGESKELVDESSVNELKVQPADADSLLGPPVEKKPFHFLIRIPRFDDEKVRDEITHAQLKVDEKTEARKSIASELQVQRNICKDLRNAFHGCLEEQKKLRDLHRSKRQEIDSQLSIINKARDAISMDDIDEKIRNMKHMIEHESLNLKEEKQYVREIEKLKQTRDDLSANMGKQDEVRHALEQKDQVEKQLKLLRKEADLLREKLVKAQDITTAARKKLDVEAIKLQQLQAAFNDADGCRQQEYMHVQNLWGPLNEKNKFFRKYKDDVKAAYNYTSGEREALEQHCVNQVETFMELWNNNDEFRRDYVKSNLRSTLRRLGTHDGRSLGPDEEPPVIPNAVIYKKTLPIVSIPEEKKEKKAAAPPLPLESDKSVKANDEVKVTKMQKQIKDVPIDKIVVKSKMAEIEPDPLVSSSKSVSGTDKVEQVSEEVTVVEDEMSKKMEELRKEEEAARLKEQLRLEQIAKAKEAMERKKQKAEKAQARAVLRAKKEEEKRAKKMEKKKAAVVETTERTVNGETTAREAPVAVTNEAEQQDKPSTVTKRSSKPLRFTKTKSIPPPLRNRGKRRMQSWMWLPILALAILALFWLGNHDLLSKLSLPKFGH